MLLCVQLCWTSLKENAEKDEISYSVLSAHSLKLEEGTLQGQWQILQ